MDSSFILSNILNPPVLFFFIGMVAVFLQSDLDIPLPRPKLFSLYLLFAIGFKGDREIHESGIDISIAVVAIASIIGIFIANVLGMSQGDALLFAVLCASASYHCRSCCDANDRSRSEPQFVSLDGSCPHLSLQHY
nr:sodium-dependent bicarbonate transport family permease [Lusitaniella coriacea]